MNELDSVNIPAFKRKRSLAAKARNSAKQSISLATPKKSKARKAKRTYRIHAIEELPLTTQMPSNELFPEPELEDYEPISKKADSEIREMAICGTCDGYFDKIDVAVIKVTSAIREGDILIFEKDDGLFQQPIQSMQQNHRDISLARSGSDIGVKVCMKPKVGTPVYKVI